MVGEVGTRISRHNRAEANLIRQRGARRLSTVIDPFAQAVRDVEIATGSKLSPEERKELWNTVYPEHRKHDELRESFGLTRPAPEARSFEPGEVEGEEMHVGGMGTYVWFGDAWYKPAFAQGEESTRTALEEVLGRPLANTTARAKEPRPIYDTKAVLNLVRKAFDSEAPSYYVVRCGQCAMDGRPCGYPHAVVPTSTKDRSDPANEKWKLVTVAINHGRRLLREPRWNVFRRRVPREIILRERIGPHEARDEARRSYGVLSDTIWKPLARKLAKIGAYGIAAFFSRRDTDVLTVTTPLNPEAFFALLGERSEGWTHQAMLLLPTCDAEHVHEIEAHLTKWAEVLLRNMDGAVWWDEQVQSFFRRHTYRFFGGLAEMDEVTYEAVTDVPICGGKEIHADGDPWTILFIVDKMTGAGLHPKPGTLDEEKRRWRSSRLPMLVGR